MENQAGSEKKPPARLAELEAQFEKELACELVSAYLLDTQDSMERMQESIFNQDARALKSIAHMLKGASRIVMADEIEKLCTEMEEYGISVNWLKAEMLYEKLNRQFEVLVEYLRRYLQ
ncbi:MAG TPA: Hpt domain-containing protein [Candidatus Obscuribacter sp.]|nr:Hpt domain-containing protein [Candidatus Obscuribacter sp.]